MKSGDDDTVGGLGLELRLSGLDWRREEEMRSRSMFLGRAEGPCVG